MTEVIGFLGTFFSGVSLYFQLKEKYSSHQMINDINILLIELKRAKSIHNCFERYYYDQFKDYYQKNSEQNTYDKRDISLLIATFSKLSSDDNLDYYIDGENLTTSKTMSEDNKEVVKKFNADVEIGILNKRYPQMIKKARLVVNGIKMMESQVIERDEQEDTPRVIDNLNNDIISAMRHADTSIKALIDLLSKIGIRLGEKIN